METFKELYVINKDKNLIYLVGYGKMIRHNTNDIVNSNDFIVLNLRLIAGKDYPNEDKYPQINNMVWNRVDRFGKEVQEDNCNWYINESIIECLQENGYNKIDISNIQIYD